MITAEQAADIRARETALKNWLGKVEVFEFITNPPERYFLYVKAVAPNGMHGIVTTWTGERLGDCQLGHTYRDNFGGERQSIQVQGINGHDYAGTYFKSAGEYARVKAIKIKGRAR